MIKFIDKFIKVMMNRNLITFITQKKLTKFKRVCNRNYYTQDGVYGFKLKTNQYYDVLQDYLETRNKFSNFYRLVTAFREHAHKQANIDPIALTNPSKLVELDPTRYGLNLHDVVSFKGILNTPKIEGTVEEALEILNNVYSGFIGAEFTYLETQEEREWFAERLEAANTDILDDKTKKSVLKEMLKGQVFDEFLAIKFVTTKRYSGAGADSMMAFMYEFLQLCAAHDLEYVVMCLAHRGRVALLTGLLNFPPEKLFRKYRGLPEFPDDIKATGDVSSHFVVSDDLTIDDKKVHVTMIPNPSHLEAVNPVSMGKTRAVMQQFKEGGYSKDKKSYWSDKIINLQIHGDAAYAGQGVNQECAALSGVPNFTIGGTIHFVINNQLGFTLPASWARSSRYCTDLAKSIAAPVLHVNGDEPEEIVRATRIAFEYQRKFRKDIFIDMNCFRKFGHNEIDEPAISSPLLYKIINDRRSVPDRYREKLESNNTITKEESEQIMSDYKTYLANALKQVDNYIPQPSYFTHQWEGFQQAQSTLTTWDTGVDLSLLHYIISKSVNIKDNFKIYPGLLKSHVHARLKKLETGEHLDWATAETAALGSLLYQGYNIRFSGQDVGRGTFSHRHTMIVDQATGEIHVPLNSIAEGQTGQIEIANSILSEEAVLGYEYGFSIASPSTLTIWEAQFGDFVNGAQTVLDCYLTGGETKWMLCSGLTILLPHGYDGVGPEHSSCRIERFLQLTDSKENVPDGDDVNIQVVNPTTPAQYFHVLRRQMVRNFRKPLIIVAPKVLLRHEFATSSLSDMAPGTRFKNVIGDDRVDETKVDRVILVSGKHYYELVKQRDIIGAQNTAIIRVESLCPFPLMELNEELGRYRNARRYIWCQEEPQNGGAWTFIKPRFENLCGKRLKYCGREALATPAVGVGQVHDREALEVTVKPFIME